MRDPMTKKSHKTARSGSFTSIPLNASRFGKFDGLAFCRQGVSIQQKNKTIWAICPRDFVNVRQFVNVCWTLINLFLIFSKGRYHLLEWMERYQDILSWIVVIARKKLNSVYILAAKTKLDIPRLQCLLIFWLRCP